MLKQTILILFTILFSCKSETQVKNQEKEIEHYIIGTWYTIFKEEPEVIEDSDEAYLEAQFEIESKLKVFGKNQYYKENKFTSNDLLKITYLHSTGSVTMNFRISSSGVWSIKKNKVLFNTNFPSIDIDFKGSNASTSAEREIVKFYRNEIATSIKKELLENEDKPSTVLNINGTTMELEDSDGLILKYKRMSKAPKVFDVSILPNDNFSEEQLKKGQSIIDILRASGSPDFILGEILPQSKKIKLYDNPRLSGKPVHSITIKPKERDIDKVLIVFDIQKNSDCGNNFKVLYKTGHYGWISGCEKLNLNWMKLDEIDKRKQSKTYQTMFKELEAVYSK